MTLPVVALRDIIVFPHMTVNLDIGRKESIEAVRAAGRSDRYLAMIMQRDGKVETPQEEDLYSFGTVVKVKQMLQLPGEKRTAWCHRWRMCRKSSRQMNFAGKPIEGLF